MHDIEPFFNWRHLYTASEDPQSPFWQREYSEFTFTHAVYNYLIHPQWDHFGSNTLYMKILYADYIEGYCIIELIGEWNDALYNDIMILKREVIELLEEEGIQKFILIGENVLNYHSSDDSYYEEWYQEVEDGWIAFVNFRDHVLQEFHRMHIDFYVNFGGKLDEMEWRKLAPIQVYGIVQDLMQRRLG
ncbi:MAG: hypothetical protein JNK73_02870 [Bacteroidia bacterium]|nr:hypothetical protein [Bacteroidia bacterium]